MKYYILGLGPKAYLLTVAKNKIVKAPKDVAFARGQFVPRFQVWRKQRGMSFYEVMLPPTKAWATGSTS